MPEIGTAGVPVFEGREADRYIEELQGSEGIRQLAKILRREPAAYTVNNMIMLSARNAKIRVVGATDKPIDRQAAEFVQQCWNDMSRDAEEAFRFALSCTAFGFSDLHIVYKRRTGNKTTNGAAASNYNDGRIGWRKLAVRRQETIEEWKRDENGDPRFMVQRDPATGDLYTPVEIDRMLHFRAGEDRGAWEGIGWLEPAYRLAHMISNLELIYGIGQQRAHVGLPVFKFLTKPDAETVALVETIAKRLIVNEQQYVRYPGLIVEFDLKTVSNGNATELREGINGFRWELMTLALASFIRLGNTSTGAYSVASPLLSLFKSSVDAAINEVMTVLNRHAIPRLLAYNPDVRWTALPRFVASSITPLPDGVMQFLGAIQSWLLTMPLDDANWLRTAIGLPEAKEILTVAAPAETVASSKPDIDADEFPSTETETTTDDEQPADNTMRVAAYQMLMAANRLREARRL